jgi:hypothetical protein
MATAKGRRLSTAAAIAALVLCALAPAGGVSVQAAPSAPPTLNVDPSSGPPGLAVTLTGSGFAADQTYQLLICPPEAVSSSPCGYGGAYIDPARQFVADSDGAVPAGTTGVIPSLPAGRYTIEAFAANVVAATADIDVSAPTLTIDPAHGPSGSTITLGGQGYGPGASYTICIVPSNDQGCGYEGVVLGELTADGNGMVPPSTTVVIPGSQAGAFSIGVFLPNSNPVLLAIADYTVDAPTLTLAPAAGPGGSQVAASGTGYAPGAAYTLCLVPAEATQCGGVGTYVGTFSAGANGDIPAGTVATMPSGAAGNYLLGVLVTSSTPELIVTAPIALTAGTVAPSASPAPSTAPPSPSPTPATTASPSPSPTASPGAPAANGGGNDILLLLLALLLAAVAIAVAWWWWRRSRQGRATTHN